MRASATPPSSSPVARLRLRDTLRAWTSAPHATDPRLQSAALNTMRVVFGGTVTVLATFTVRNLIVGAPTLWVDPVNLVLVASASWWIRRDPRALRPASWLVLATLTVNILLSLNEAPGHLLTPTHLLLPLIVLYGSLIGDLVMTATSTIGMLSVVGLTVARAQVISPYDRLLATNLVVAILAIAILSLAGWAFHRQLVRAIHDASEETARELAAKERLNATIFHDIANPLTALQTTLSLAEPDGTLASEDVAVATRMADRIAGIIEAVRALNAPGQTAAQLAFQPVAVDVLVHDLRESFAPRLEAKEQTLEIIAGCGISVRTNPTVMRDSVLANFVINASKFSPRGARIEVSAVHDGMFVRIEVRDRGTGFPREVLSHGDTPAPSLALASRPGTEAERGHGVGLRIATHYLSQLGGRLHIRNAADGGGVVSALLPVADAA
jgi:signal transduction histidine kinase